LNTSNRSLIATIVVSAVVVAGALVYAGYQYANQPSEERIVALIQEQLNGAGEASDRGLTEEEVISLIDRRMDERKASGLSQSAFNERVEKGILAFIDKQQRAERERPNELAKNVPRPNKSDHIYGNPNAPVTLIEYSDFECPYCKQFHVNAKRLVDESDGRVNWVYRHFPLEFHNPGAQKQAEAAECAAALGGNDAFWKMTNTIYERTKAGGKGFPLENLGPLAAEIGLNQKEFQTCLDSGRMAARVQADYQSGLSSGVTGTPGNILLHAKSGRVQAMHGSIPLERLKDAVDRIISGK
jgi:protein-disulfide isomerase